MQIASMTVTVFFTLQTSHTVIDDAHKTLRPPRWVPQRQESDLTKLELN